MEFERALAVSILMGLTTIILMFFLGLHIKNDLKKRKKFEFFDSKKLFDKLLEGGYTMAKLQMKTQVLIFPLTHMVYEDSLLRIYYEPEEFVLIDRENAYYDAYKSINCRTNYIGERYAKLEIF